LTPKKCARDAFSYFPNSFRRGILGSSRRASVSGIMLTIEKVSHL
jgi:hypothetical protein